MIELHLGIFPHFALDGRPERLKRTTVPPSILRPPTSTLTFLHFPSRLLPRVEVRSFGVKATKVMKLPPLPPAPSSILALNPSHPTEVNPQLNLLSSAYDRQGHVSSEEAVNKTPVNRLAVSSPPLRGTRGPRMLHVPLKLRLIVPVGVLSGTFSKGL